MIKSAFVFGANGSGKSNFISAIDFMKKIVLAELSLQSKMVSNIDNFAFSETSSRTPSVFEVEFIADGMVFEYGFEILNSEVNREYLYRKTKRRTPVFIRTSPDFKDISLSKDMENVRVLTKNTRRDTLFLYWANGGNNDMAMTAYRWFESIQIFDASDSSQLSNKTIRYLEECKDNKNNVLGLLQRADVDILDFDVDFLKKSMTTKHTVYNENWEEAGIVSTPFSFESAGTRKLFEIAGPIIKALENGKVVFVDEIDSRLHPVIVRFVVSMFNSMSNNQNNAQLICNMHDVLLLDGDIRRDQVYFTEKDGYGVSKLYALTDFKGVRKESKLLKRYLLGAFGAAPKLKSFQQQKQPSSCCESTARFQTKRLNMEKGQMLL